MTTPTWVRESNRDTSFSLGVDSNSATRQFLVKFSSGANTNEYDAISNCGVAKNDAHPALSSIYCNEITAKDVDPASHTLFQVTCNYSSKDLTNITWNRDDAPWNQDARLQFSTVTYESQVINDYTNTTSGDIPLNSAGDIIPGIVYPKRNIIIGINFAVKKSDISVTTYEDIADLCDTVNSSAIELEVFGANKLTIGSEDGKLNDVNFVEQVYTDENGFDTAYFDVNISIEYNKNGHKLKYAQAGYNYLSTASDFSTKKQIVLSDDTTPSVPQLLNANGTKNTTGVPVYKYITIYKPEDWSTLVNLINNRKD